MKGERRDKSKAAFSFLPCRTTQQKIKQFHKKMTSAPCKAQQRTSQQPIPTNRIKKYYTTNDIWQN